MAGMSAAQLLDELMGRDRNLGPQDKREELDWADSQICKHYIVSFCPHQLFVNTKADLGPCDKIHDDRIKDAYKNSDRFEVMGYEEDFIRFSQSMITDVERRIKRGKQRLQLTQQENAAPKSAAAIENEEKISLLSDKIKSLLEQVESLGCEGKVEEAQGVMKLCDQLKEDRDALQRGNNPHNEINNVVEKQMEVCEVCGAFLIVGDAQQRLDDHLMGKQHCGYAMLRSTLEEVATRQQKRKDERELQRETERDNRHQRKDEDRPKEDFRRRNNDNDWRRNDDRRRNDNRWRRDDDDRRKRGNTRNFTRRNRSRSKSRDRNTRYDKYSNNKRRSRSRENRRDYDKDRRSRDYKRRSGSRDRRRSRSNDSKRRSRSTDRHSRSKDRRSKSGSKDRKPADHRRQSRSSSTDSNAKNSNEERKEPDMPPSTEVYANGDNSNNNENYVQN